MLRIPRGAPARQATRSDTRGRPSPSDRASRAPGGSHAIPGVPVVPFNLARASGAGVGVLRCDRTARRRRPAGCRRRRRDADASDSDRNGRVRRQLALGGNGSIDAVRYPNFARLAQKATWYPRATTVADYTTDAVPAILTGRNESRRAAGARRPSRQPVHPPRRAFRHSRAEQVTRLCPARYCREPGLGVSLADRQRGRCTTSRSDICIRFCPGR